MAFLSGAVRRYFKNTITITTDSKSTTAASDAATMIINESLFIDSSEVIKIYVSLNVETSLTRRLIDMQRWMVTK